MSLVPYVVEQTARGERSYDIFSRLLNDRIIVLSEDVNPTSASVIIAQLLYLEGQDPEKPWRFHYRRYGHPRYHEVYQVRCFHHLRGHGCFHGCIFAGQRHQGQAFRPAEF